MRASPCLCNSRRALYRVFVSPTGAEALSLSRQALPLPRPHAPGRIADQIRTVKWSSRTRQDPAPAQEEVSLDDDEDPKKAYMRRFTTQESVEASGRGRLPQDHEITDPRIMVLDNDAVEGPMSPATALDKLQPEESLRMVKTFIAADPKSGRPQQLALCKIVNKRDEYARQKEARDRKKADAKPKLKMVEMSWAIGPHDLETKMRRLADFLGKGHKVEVAFGKKRGGKKVTDEDAQAVLRGVKEEIEKLGAKETKAAEGTVGGQLRLTAEMRAKN